MTIERLTRDDVAHLPILLFDDPDNGPRPPYAIAEHASWLEEDGRGRRRVTSAAVIGYGRLPDAQDVWVLAYAGSVADGIAQSLSVVPLDLVTNYEPDERATSEEPF